ncbi:MAG: parallel beta-helix repeat containing protein, partial [Mucilaginibacter sp.]|nr:parallel beta-helix repeat containing protein [Mucilaginibacter sp.]
NINISLNTVANCADGGIKVHNAHDIQITNNTIYNNGTQLIMSHDNVAPNSPLRNISVNNNIFFSKTADQLTLSLSTISNDIKNTGDFNNNYYSRPADNDLIIGVSQVSGGVSTNQKLSLNSWQALFSKDTNSPKSSWKIPIDTVTKVNGTNKYANGDFNTNTNGLYGYASAGNFSATWNNNGTLDGGCLKVSFNSVLSSSNFGSVIIGIGQVAAGKTYRLKFSIQGSDNYKAATAYLRYSLSPYSDISDRVSCSITQARMEKEILFTASTSVSNASVAFDIPEQPSPVYLDNIKLEEVDATKVDADQYLTFVYNNQTALNSFNIVPGVDVYTTKYQNSITLQPFLSSIILKDVVNCPSPPAKPVIKSNP